MGQLDGRRALITGGANGIGAETARLFAAEGATVAIADLASAADRAAAVVNAIVANGGHASLVAMDVRDVPGARAAVDEAARQMGGIDTVVASAGLAVAPGGSFRGLVDLDPTAFDAIQEVNVRGVLVVLQRAAQLMLDAGQGGAMVTLASYASKRATAGAYAVSKAAVWMLTRCLAAELAPHGIRVNAIGPGYIDTDMIGAVAAAASPDGDQQAWREQRRQQIPLGRFGSAADVAQTALFLCSDASSFYTGSILHPDGGITSAYAGG